uniref:Integrase core domain-containing protein n=1 Tax=Oncorhynchus tshawytscha TaxID=74940 RepID=A0AAZ3S787_ONCTS
MEQFRGGERGSALRGRSTHNQRMERLWGDVWHGVSNVYHDLFTFLETEQIIDINNEVHLWALHFVFLPQVNRDLAVFASQWNHHGLRTEQRQSPLQLFVSGSLAIQRANLTAVRDLFTPNSTTISSQATTSAPPTTTSAPPTTTSAPPTTTSAPPTTISAPPTTTSAPPTTTSAPPTTTSAPQPPPQLPQPPPQLLQPPPQLPQPPPQLIQPPPQLIQPPPQLLQPTPQLSQPLAPQLFIGRNGGLCHKSSSPSATHRCKCCGQSFHLKAPEAAWELTVYRGLWQLYLQRHSFLLQPDLLHTPLILPYWDEGLDAISSAPLVPLNQFIFILYIL